MDLKTKAATAILRCDEDLYHNSRNPQYAWHAWQVARKLELPTPE